jgi:hypothetical protein
MGWAGHVANVRESRGCHRVLVRNLRERDYLKDPGVDGSVYVKMDLQEIS